MSFFEQIRRRRLGAGLCAGAAAAWGALWLGAAAATAAGPWPDDHGDTPAEATWIAPGSAIRSTIAVDTDVDWLRFAAQPGVAYRIAVTADTLWDAVLELRAADGRSVLAVVDSSRSPLRTAATDSPTNSAPAVFYVGVSGFARFTTGVCEVVVAPLGTPAPGGGTLRPAPPRGLRVAPAAGPVIPAAGGN